MDIDWQAIRNRAIQFQNRWKDASNERSEAQSFLYELLRDVYQVDPRRVGTFEKKVHPASDRNGYIDMLWPGRILFEMKSRGKSLDKAHEQARKYAFAITSDEDLPEYIMVSDFANIRLYNLTTDQIVEFKTAQLSENVERLSILTQKGSKYDLAIDKELNAEAAYQMAKLHDLLLKNRYSSHDLELYLVRILFCLFADHTGIFRRGAFFEYVSSSKEDGSDLAGKMAALFDILDTPQKERMASLSQELKEFPYINGGLFHDTIRSASFDHSMRELLIACCSFDWSAINPSIFGAMFQSVMDPGKRSTLGAQYTPQHIIKKVVKPLFIDELYQEFDLCKDNPGKLEKFHHKLENLSFLDPACGCGNFLIVSYMVIRRLELELVRYQYPRNSDLPDDFSLDENLRVNVGQFYGIDIDEFSCQVARTAMWLIDHQMNAEAAHEFGKPFLRIPLMESAHIFHANALTKSWAEIIGCPTVAYILGNPPYLGAKKRSPEKNKELVELFGANSNCGSLDYVSGWYYSAAKMIANSSTKVSFVSTNSISRGQQVYYLWKQLYALGVDIVFGHRGFKWDNQAKGTAQVHCVIYGFQNKKYTCGKKYIFNEDDSFEEVSIINPYLDGLQEVTLVKPRTQPLYDVPHLRDGNKPIDNQNYLFTKDEYLEFIQIEPASKPYFRLWYGSKEFIAKSPRYCLWLRDCTPQELSKMPHAVQRIKAVRQFRAESTDPGTRKLSDRPLEFHIETLPSERYLIIPEVSGENREYIPIGFMEPEVLCSSLVRIMQHPTLYHYGVLTSKAHMLWTKAICGRLDNRVRYTTRIVYNNFPWPNPTSIQKQEIEKCAAQVLDIQNKYSDTSYKLLYNPNLMPDDLRAAHRLLDRAVYKAFGLPTTISDKDCVIELFRLHRELVQKNP